MGAVGGVGSRPGRSLGRAAIAVQAAWSKHAPPGDHARPSWPQLCDQLTGRPREFATYPDGMACLLGAGLVGRDSSGIGIPSRWHKSQVAAYNGKWLTATHRSSWFPPAPHTKQR